jgi:methyl-accepting chemotaxis protein
VRSILSEIQNGINSSVMLTEEAGKRVEAGKETVDVAHRTITQMEQTTQESIEAFQQILGATNQQQMGLEQITIAMRDILQSTQQTALGTGQLEKAVESLNALGLQLKRGMEAYRI